MPQRIQDAFLNCTADRIGYVKKINQISEPPLWGRDTVCRGKVLECY